MPPLARGGFLEMELELESGRWLFIPGFCGNPVVEQSHNTGKKSYINGCINHIKDHSKDLLMPEQSRVQSRKWMGMD